jgi:hypothetical protein
MNKEKIFELKIEDEDELSGIDSISLVDEPAIEINWMYFNKTKEHNFDEDAVYTQHLMSVGESEDDLLAEGWVVDSVDYLDGKEEFVNTDPNAPSSGDEKEYKVRYKYILNPKITGEPAIIETSRPFCRELIRENKVFRIEDIDSAVNDFGQSPRTYRGSWNCRHIWSRIKYRNDATIINKASVNRGKTEVGGFPNDILPDPLSGQPDTVTDRVKKAVSKGTAAPSTQTNLGMSKEDFAKISIDYDNILSTQRGKDLARRLINEGNNLYIVTKRRRTESNDVYRDAQAVGIPRDRVFFTEGRVKWMKLKELGIQRHIDNNPEEIADINKNAPLIRADKFEVGVPHYTEDGKLYTGPTHKDADGRLMTGAEHNEDSEYLYHEDELGYDNNLPSFVDEGVKKKKKKDQKFATDDEKRIVIGPAMVPDLKIFRKDKEGNPYYVVFKEDTIKMIMEKYMRNKYTDNNDENHNGNAVKDVYVIESWIKEDMEDKSNKYGYEDLPIGTWFVSMKVRNDEVWKKVKNGELNGFSVSGWFEEVAMFCREEMFLRQVAEILKKY